MTAEVVLVEDGVATEIPDAIAAEEPLEIRLVAGGEMRTAAVTMRTPGADRELALGFLLSEGVIQRREDVAAIGHLPRGGDGSENVLVVRLRDGLEPPSQTLERHFLTTSACGLCGKSSLQALELPRHPELPPGPRIPATVLYQLPEALRRAQGVFATTGGLHAAGLFDTGGELLACREDVGRHNALDKLLGHALEQGWLPLHRHLVMVSGRASFELVQKCLLAEAPVLCAVSAPSSLAVATARRFRLTLVGFLRERRCNIYSEIQRIISES
ncbi:MAG: formate dehydrogenase accessory sulfurtransferase FdhD [Acidobacteriota bacterium]|nr:formate dehydrogenase accessory sulfurtransferase FdhD [Acidobacteriota bacterium]